MRPPLRRLRAAGRACFEHGLRTGLACLENCLQTGLACLENGLQAGRTGLKNGLYLARFFSHPGHLTGPAAEALPSHPAQMSSSSSYPTTEPVATAEAAAEAGEPPKKKRREASSKPRAPARPYRRIDADVLESRIRDLNKRLAVLRSKVVLLEDRLESHDNEAEIRKTETV